jgi:glutamate-5-semialdehyde dehydrogenase
MVSYVKRLVSAARQTSYVLPQMNSALKDKILKDMATYLIQENSYILRENKKDIEAGKKSKLKLSFLDRLALNVKRIQEMSVSLKEIAHLPDPVNKVIDGWRRPNGLSIERISVPIGVVFIIYEARPNVTSDSIGLCFKSSNVAILRGGSNAVHSNKAIVNVCAKAVRSSNIKYEPFFFVDRSSYKVVDYLLKQDKFIDVVIPRGGESLIRKVAEKSSIPVIKHYQGICHVYVDESADLTKALKICTNAKVQRPSVCNAVETIIVHKKIAMKFLPRLKKEFDKYKVEIRGDEKSVLLLKRIKKATAKDWSTEYLDLKVSIKIVNTLDEAIKHINHYGSHHTDSILTQNMNNAQKFIQYVDSACCFVNISTRFSDGYQFGLGAELGISTDKLHARGPMGLRELTTYKWVVRGNGQIRE